MRKAGRILVKKALFNKMGVCAREGVGQPKVSSADPVLCSSTSDKSLNVNGSCVESIPFI